MKRSLQFDVVLALITTLALAPVSAAAQASEPPETAGTGGAAAAPTDARTRFEAGRLAFREGRFDEALWHFQRSYELSGRPELLYNIGATHDRLGHVDLAIAAYEQFLTDVPDAENRLEVQARIAELRTGSSTTVVVPDEPLTPVAPSSGPNVLFTFVSAGAALVTGALAVGFWVAANDQYAALDAGCLRLRGGCTREEVGASGVETYVTLTNVFLVSSLVLTAATAIILPIELTSGPSDASTPTAAVRLGPGSLFLEGTF